MRWVFLLLGGLTVAPIPLLVLLLPLLILVFGPPADAEASELIINSAIAGPGLFLAAMVTLPMLIAALPLPMAVFLGLGEALVRGRRRVGVCVLDHDLGARPDPLDRRLERVGQLIRRVRSWTRGRVLAVGVGGFALLLLGLSFVIRDEDMLPWNAGLIGLLGAGLFFFSLSMWTELLIKGLDWIRKPPGLRAGAEERGRRRLDVEREKAEMLARGTADREPVTGVVTTKRPIRSPLGGVEAVAVRLQGRVGRWTIDDAFVAPELTLRVDDGRDVQVRATDWVLRLPTVPAQLVERTAELDDRLEELGVPRSEARLAEAVIRVGDRVTVFADASQEHAPGEGYRDGRTLVLTGEGDRPAVLSVDPV